MPYFSEKIFPDLDFQAILSEVSTDDYYKFVFRYSRQHYRNRIDMAGFTDGGRVLDIGCGYGQWALALAERNEYVIGVDRLASMVQIGRLLADQAHVGNVEFQVGELPSLKFPDESFDLIFCWGLFMFLDRTETLREFNRLLKPGGRFLIGCCNASGRWLYKLFQSMRERRFNRPLFKTCLNALLRGADLRALPNRTALRDVQRLCGYFGFECTASGLDGSIDVTGQDRKLPMFAPHFLFLENNIEFIAQKVRSL